MEIQIKELIHHGFRPVDCHGMGNTLTDEITRLFTKQDARRSPSQGGDMPRLDGGRFEVNPNSGAEEIGVQLAQAL